MASHATSGAETPQRSVVPVATGVALGAGILMIVVGVFDALSGISAIFRDNIYVQTPAYVYAFDVTAWGWIHLVLGVLVAVTGVGVVLGKQWARVAGVILVGLSLIANFLSIPHYPLWSILVIGLDVLIMWGLVNDQRER